jgi:MoxR-like ATPase
MPAKLDITTEQIVSSVVTYFEGQTEITTANLREWCNINDYGYATIKNRLNDYKSGRGKFNLDVAKQVLETTYDAPTAQPAVNSVQTVTQELDNLVPDTDETFVSFGNFKDVKAIIRSKVFYPLFITGLSGNGKTHGVEQACAQLKREIVRVNITIETDEDDLIGGFRLINGETVWQDGPVVQALKRGAILLLDEVDLASNKIMCLQSLLEGKGVFLKKTNTYVRPTAGFNVIATANTKGRGSDDGKFIGTNVLNEAFLERFAVTFEQEYPTQAIEKKILLNNFKQLGWVGDNIDELANNLVTWADIIRKTYYDGGCEEVITTRRLVNVAKAWAIWDNVEKAIQLCTNRFDDDTKKVFVELYSKIAGEQEVQSDSHD